MKKESKKNLTAFVICIIVLVIIFLWYFYHKTNNNNQSDISNDAKDKVSNIVGVVPSDIKTPISTSTIKEGAVNIFYANFSKTIYENETTKEPGIRSQVIIGQSSRYPQTGDARGKVIVNDSTGKFVYIRGAYVFYTKYDVIHNWFTLTKNPIKVEPVGDE
jgi:hypothetical protein